MHVNHVTVTCTSEFIHNYLYVHRCSCDGKKEGFHVHEISLKSHHFTDIEVQDSLLHTTPKTWRELTRAPSS